MLKDLTDEQLVERAVRDDPEAFGEIVKRWERRIFALCFGMLGREDDARDAAQEAFIAAYRNLAKFRGEAKVSSWLHRIAVNQCLTTKRRQKVRAEDFIDEDSESEIWITKDLKMNTRDFFSTLFKTSLYSRGVPWGYMMEATTIDKKTGEKTFMQVTRVDEKSNLRFSLADYQITNLGSFTMPQVE